MVSKCETIKANFSVAINYLKSDLIKKQRSFKIGLVSIYLVVFFLTLLLNAIELCPVIFIKLAEEQASEIDLIFTPYLMSQNVENKKSAFDTYLYNKTKKSSSPQSNITQMLSSLSFLNFYDIEKKLENFSLIEGVSPRWMIKGQTSNLNNSNITSTFSANIFILDSARENKIGIGRKVYSPELNMSECYVSNTLSNALKLKIGDMVKMDIKLSDLLSAYQASSGDDQDEDEAVKKLRRRKSGKIIIEDENYNARIKNNFNPNEDYDITNINNEENNENNDNNKNNNLLGGLNKNLVDLCQNNFGNYIDKYLSKIKESDLNLIETLINSPLFSEKLLFNYLKDIPILKPFENILKPKNNRKLILESSTLSSNNILSIVKKVLKYKKYLTNSKGLCTAIFDDFDPSQIINVVSSLSLQFNLTVKSIIESDIGKFPTTAGNSLSIDSNYVTQYLKSNVERAVDQIIEKITIPFPKEIIISLINSYLDKFDIYNYSLTVNAIFSDKFTAYNKNQMDMRHHISEIAGGITSALGQNFFVNINAPVYIIMNSISVAIIFLRDIFIGIMVFLWMLSVLLVYSLMLGNVDERTYEFGMLRALGFQKNNLILVILIQGLLFAIPGVILGLITSYIANNFVAFLFSKYTKLAMPFYLSNFNIIFGVVIGISIPLISSYFPIKKCLADNLKDSLTIFNKKIGDIVVSMIKLENIGVSPTTLISSITLIVIGILTYYVVPVSFMLMNMTVFLLIMIAILVTMLLGLIILMQLLIPFLQTVILKIIFLIAIPDKKLHFIVLKNLEGHKRRDRQVSIMFMVALGFVIFAGCTLNLVVDFVETMTKGMTGGDFSIYVTDFNDPNKTLNEKGINEYIENTKKVYPDIIQNHAYISYTTNEIFGFRSSVGTLAGFPIKNRKVIGIDKNFIDSTYTNLLTVTEYDKNLNYSYINGKIDVIKMLYQNPNVPYLLEGSNNSFIFPVSNSSMLDNYFKGFQFNLVAAEGIRQEMGISVDNPAKVYFNTFRGQSIPCKIVGLAAKLPGVLTYSSYFTIAQLSEVFISMDQLKKLLEIERKVMNEDFGNVTNSTVDGIRKKQFILKFKDNVASEYKKMVFFAMNNYLQNVGVFSVLIDDIITTANEIKEIMGYIFLVLGIIALVLSFFLIWTSFYSNIKENIAEYGIMRSIGVTKKQSVRIYLYEAATIIISSIIVGTLIGIIISSTLILQFDIFLELPFVFSFPYKLYFSLIIVGLILGLLGSYYPTYAVNSLGLVKIMKGFNE